MSIGVILLSLVFVALSLAPFIAASGRDDGILILPE
jgi:hypothetical protein